VVSLIRTVGFFSICMKSSINLHKKLFAGVIVAPMRFFELNPVGKLTGNHIACESVTWISVWFIIKLNCFNRSHFESFRKGYR
jgi:hypothetical protein